MAKGKYEYWLTEDGLTLLRGWARRGLTDEQIAHNIGIGIRTLYDWKKSYPQILQALKEAKEIIDDQVECALLKRALGYDWTEDKVEMDGEGNITKITKTKKHVPPDSTSLIFWLKNRMKNDWRDRPVDENNGPDLSRVAEILDGVESVID